MKLFLAVQKSLGFDCLSGFKALDFVNITSPTSLDRNRCCEVVSITTLRRLASDNADVYGTETVWNVDNTVVKLCANKVLQFLTGGVG